MFRWRRRRRVLFIIFAVLLVILLLKAVLIKKRYPLPTPLGSSTTRSQTDKKTTDFPKLQLDFFDASKIHPDARGFQIAEYDENYKRVFFFSWGPMQEPLGTVLVYDTKGDFKSPSSYQALDVAKITGNPNATGFGAGFVDNYNQYAYLIALKKLENGKIVSNPVTARINLRGDLTSNSSYETFDLSALNLAHYGWATGTDTPDYAYYAPVIDANQKGAPHGIFLRHNAKKPLADKGAWEHYDLSKIDRQAVGFQSIEYKAPYVYLIPFGVGYTHMVRYDTRRDFSQRSSYELFDLKNIHPDASGYTGWEVVGDYLILSPWKDLSRSKRETSMYIALAYDTRKPFANKNSWQYLDLRTVDPNAKGYQGAWVDKNGFVYFVPTANFSIGKPPPFVIWNSAKPFSDKNSWVSSPSTGVPPSTEAGYSPDNNAAYLAPYGTGNSGLITRVEGQ